MYKEVEFSIFYIKLVEFSTKCSIIKTEKKYKKSIFDKIKLYFDYRKIKKILNLHKVLNEDILKRLPYEINIALEEAKLKDVEDEIISYGNFFF